LLAAQLEVAFGFGLWSGSLQLPWMFCRAYNKELIWVINLFTKNIQTSRHHEVETRARQKKVITDAIYENLELNIYIKKLVFKSMTFYHGAKPVSKEIEETGTRRQTQC